jgi:hypothetical protein
LHRGEEFQSQQPTFRQAMSKDLVCSPSPAKRSRRFNYFELLSVDLIQLIFELIPELTKREFLEISRTCRLFQDHLSQTSLALNFRFKTDPPNDFRDLAYPNKKIWGELIDLKISSYQINHRPSCVPHRKIRRLKITMKGLLARGELGPERTVRKIFAQVQEVIEFKYETINCDWIPPHIQELKFHFCQLRNIEALGPRKRLFFHETKGINCKYLCDAEKLAFQGCDAGDVFGSLANAKSLQHVYITDWPAVSLFAYGFDHVPNIVLETTAPDTFKGVLIPENITTLQITKHAFTFDLSHFKHCKIERLFVSHGDDGSFFELPLEWADTLKIVVAPNYLVKNVQHMRNLEVLVACCESANDFSKLYRLTKFNSYCFCAQRNWIQNIVRMRESRLDLSRNAEKAGVEPVNYFHHTHMCEFVREDMLKLFNSGMW